MTKTFCDWCGEQMEATLPFSLAVRAGSVRGQDVCKNCSDVLSIGGSNREYAADKVLEWLRGSARLLRHLDSEKPAGGIIPPPKLKQPQDAE